MMATASVLIPDTEEGIRHYLLSAMSSDPSGKAASSLVMAYVDLARKEGQLLGLKSAQIAVNLAFEAGDKINAAISEALL
jgi:hypothetical protein